MEIRFCYQVLELSAGSSQSELKQAYKDLVQVWHPDRFSHNPRLQAKAAQKLVQINEAYETLGRVLEERERLQAQFEQVEATRSTHSSHEPATRKSVYKSAYSESAARESAASEPAARESAARRARTATGTATAQSRTSTSSGPSASASARSSYQSNHQSGQRAQGRTRGRERYAAYRGHNYRRSFAARCFLSAIAMSFGAILLMFTPFVIAYAIAQQPGLFLLPAVAVVGVYGYRVLRIN